MWLEERKSKKKRKDSLIIFHSVTFQMWLLLVMSLCLYLRYPASLHYQSRL